MNSLPKRKLNSLIRAGSLAARLHEELSRQIRPGVNVMDLEKYARDFVENNGVLASFLGYKGYPSALCISLNEEIVHGIPKDYKLQPNDVIAIDLGITVDGWIVDTARTHIVDPSDNPDSLRLILVTKEALDQAIKCCQPGYTTGDIGAIIEQTVKKGGCAVVEELHGHGVGRTLQEPPTISNFGSPGKGTRLKKGMVIAVEPITSLRPTQIKVLDDGWTIVAQDPQPTAHFEHTIIVDSPPVILTLSDNLR